MIPGGGGRSGHRERAHHMRVLKPDLNIGFARIKGCIVFTAATHRHSLLLGRQPDTLALKSVHTLRPLTPRRLDDNLHACRVVLSLPAQPSLCHFPAFHFLTERISENSDVAADVICKTGIIAEVTDAAVYGMMAE